MDYAAHDGSSGAIIVADFQSWGGAAAFPTAQPPAEPCILVIFGASGDLTKRLLMPALYNLACDGLLPEQFAIVGMAMDELTTESFRERMTSRHQAVPHAHGIRRRRRGTGSARGSTTCPASSTTHVGVCPAGGAGDEARRAVSGRRQRPVLHGDAAVRVRADLRPASKRPGFKTSSAGWKRIIVEKPFGTDLPSAIALNREILAYWNEDQIYRIDHYLGKETVQNILAFRFSNGMFEPLWNRNYIDHIQFSVSEAVGVEGRGGYYDRSGVLRDMMQNHMFQMLAYLCMEPPGSFEPDAIRNEKAKVLQAVRIMDAEEVRAQHGARPVRRRHEARTANRRPAIARNRAYPADRTPRRSPR